MVALRLPKPEPRTGQEATPAWLQERAGAIAAEAERLVWRLADVMTAEQGEIAAGELLAHAPPGVQLHAPWLDPERPLPAGGEPDAVQRAEAQACGRAALAWALADGSGAIRQPGAVTLAGHHLDAARVVLRAKGGLGRGELQAWSADRFWRPWVDLYRMHRDSGLSERKARAAVVASMSQAGATLPGTGGFPGERVIRARLAG